MQGNKADALLGAGGRGQEAGGGLSGGSFQRPTKPPSPNIPVQDHKDGHHHKLASHPGQILSKDHGTHVLTGCGHKWNRRKQAGEVQALQPGGYRTPPRSLTR